MVTHVTKFHLLPQSFLQLLSKQTFITAALGLWISSLHQSPSPGPGASAGEQTIVCWPDEELKEGTSQVWSSMVELSRLLRLLLEWF